MPTLRFDINCGEKTCASKPGEFCRFALAQRFGTEVVCQIFSEPDGRGLLTPLGNSRDDGLGWTLRHPECIKNSEKNA